MQVNNDNDRYPGWMHIRRESSGNLLNISQKHYPLCNKHDLGCRRIKRFSACLHGGPLRTLRTERRHSRVADRSNDQICEPCAHATTMNMLRKLLWLLVFLSAGWTSACYIGISRATAFWSENGRSSATQAESYWNSILITLTLPVLQLLVFAWLFVALLSGVLTCVVTLYHLVKATVTNVDLEQCNCPNSPSLTLSTHLDQLISSSFYCQTPRTRIRVAPSHYIRNRDARIDDSPMAVHSRFR